MNKNENQKVTIHISYADEMTLCAMEASLHILNNAFSDFCEKSKIVLSEADSMSPRVVSVSNGSLIIDVIVPISCTLFNILYDIIKNKFNSNNTYTVNVYLSNCRIRWTDEDNYKLSKRILKEYVIRKSSLPINEFTDSLILSKPYPNKSIRAKIRNTKYLIENYRIPNTLNTSPLKNCSKAHEIQFNKACADWNIK